MDYQGQRDLWQKAANRQNIKLSEDHLAQLEAFIRHMLTINETMNLTRIVKPEEIAIAHIEDSLTALKHLQCMPRKELNWIDLGSGAGFPGIPLAILRPNDQITLLDALQKRVRYLTEVSRICMLENTNALHGRAEELGRSAKWRDSQDAVVIRAVASLPVLAEYALPLLNTGGKMIALKGDLSDEELSQGKELVYLMGGTIEKVERFKLDAGTLSRTIVVVKKTKPTPLRFPRSHNKIGTK